MTTPVHRTSELRLLLDQMRLHPSRDWSDTPQRAFILNRMLARESTRKGRA
ncbi:MAG TPA: hypothetical protein VN627_12055 [Novosphingobium sp.]|nr:hypothetical protein [Novosphingobium sp.]